jgi:hypothetical protein
VCDRRNGACAETICNKDEATCSEWLAALVRCGPDRVTQVFETCAIACNKGLGPGNGNGSCASPTGDQLITDRAPELKPSAELWPPPVISVCVRGLVETGRELRLIRDEVNSTWGRYSGLSFAGWGECSASSGSAQIELTLDEPGDGACRDALGTMDHWGYPGFGGTTQMHICRAYLDVETHSTKITSDDSVLRFMARHEFGHVLMGRAFGSHASSRLSVKARRRPVSSPKPAPHRGKQPSHPSRAPTRTYRKRARSCPT